jgi:hypothetical protein
MSCKGEWNSGNDSKGRVNQKYQEELERQKKAILSQLAAEVSGIYYGTQTQHMFQVK